jgi:hypothetical protein
MTQRTGVAVIVKATTLNHDGVERTSFFGPFLPHAGSATTYFLESLDKELES